MLVRILVFFLETLARLCLAVLERLSNSPVVQQLVQWLIQAAAYFVTQLLQVESVQTAVSATIAEGLNCFLRQPNLEEHLLRMSDTMSKTQPELARQQGRDFPVLVGSFLQGMLLPPPKEKKPQAADEPENATPSVSTAAPQRTQSFPMLQKTWSNESDLQPQQPSTSSSQSDCGGGRMSPDEDADADADYTQFLSASDVLMDDSSFHYRYGPTGIGSSSAVSSSSIARSSGGASALDIIDGTKKDR